VSAQPPPEQRQRQQTQQAARSASMAGAWDCEWNHMLILTAAYTAARMQIAAAPLIDEVLFDLAGAEAMVAHMGWDEVVAQPTVPGAPALHYVDCRSTRFVYTAAVAAGTRTVTAHSCTCIVVNSRL